MKLAKTYSKTAIAMLFAFALFCTGCASVIHGKTQTIPVHSTPEGAKVYHKGFFIGKTPLDLKVDREEPGTVSVEMEGCNPKEIRLEKSYIRKGLFGGLIGFVVENVDGAMLYIDPESIDIRFDDSSHPESDSILDNRNVVKLGGELIVDHKPEPIIIHKANHGNTATHGESLEGKLSFLRNMYKARAKTAEQIKEEVSKLGMPANEAASFLNELGIK